VREKAAEDLSLVDRAGTDVIDQIRTQNAEGT